MRQRASMVARAFTTPKEIKVVSVFSTATLSGWQLIKQIGGLKSLRKIIPNFD